MRVTGFRIPICSRSAAKNEVHDVEVEKIDFDYTQPNPDGVILFIHNAERVSLHDCLVRYSGPSESLIMGLAVYDSKDIEIASNHFSRCHAGVYADKSVEGLVIARNVFRGVVVQQGDFTVLWASWAIRLAGRVVAQCLENDIEDYLMGISLFYGSKAVIDGNEIRRRAMPAPLDTPQDPANISYAIDIGTDDCRVSGNRIDLTSQSYGGIRVTGARNEVTDNQLTSRYKTPSVIGPVGVFAGVYSGVPSGAGDFLCLSRNRFNGLQVAINVNSGTGMQITDNIIVGQERAGLGVMMATCTSALVSRNELRQLGVPLSMSKGVDNRVQQNRTTTTLIGALITDEQRLVFDGNSIDDAALFGVGCSGVVVSHRYSNSRIANCGHTAPQTAFSLLVLNGAQAQTSPSTVASSWIPAWRPAERSGRREWPMAHTSAR